jgi:hypothetical protein
MWKAQSFPAGKVQDGGGFFPKNVVNFNRSFCKTAAGFHIRNENEESIPQQLT